MTKELGQVPYEAWRKQQHPQAVYGGWAEMFARERSVWSSIESAVLKHHGVTVLSGLHSSLTPDTSAAEELPKIPPNQSGDEPARTP